MGSLQSRHHKIKDKHETRIQCETCVTEEDTENNTDSLLISMCDWGRKQWGMDRHYFFPCFIPLCMCIIRLPEKCLFCRLWMGYLFEWIFWKIRVQTLNWRTHYPLFLIVNVLSSKALIGDTIRFLRFLLETGPPLYMVIRARRRSSHLQGKGSTFISQSFLNSEYWSSREIRTRDLPLCRQALYQLS